MARPRETLSFSWEMSSVYVARVSGIVGFRYGDAFGPPVPLELATLATLGRATVPARIRQIAEDAAERAREIQRVDVPYWSKKRQQWRHPPNYRHKAPRRCDGKTYAFLLRHLSRDRASRRSGESPGMLAAGSQRPAGDAAEALADFLPEKSLPGHARSGLTSTAARAHRVAVAPVTIVGASVAAAPCESEIMLDALGASVEQERHPTRPRQPTSTCAEVVTTAGDIPSGMTSVATRSLAQTPKREAAAVMSTTFHRGGGGPGGAALTDARNNIGGEASQREM